MAGKAATKNNRNCINVLSKKSSHRDTRKLSLMTPAKIDAMRKVKKAGRVSPEMAEYQKRLNNYSDTHYGITFSNATDFNQFGIIMMAISKIFEIHRSTSEIFIQKVCAQDQNIPVDVHLDGCEVYSIIESQHQIEHMMIDISEAVVRLCAE